MAVATTGAIYKSLSFDGVESRNFGVYITGEAVYNAPTRDVEMVSIPGRSGAFALDKGRFENIEVTYPAGIFADNETDFASAISDFRNYLCSRKGYCRLVDEYNPEEYRMAIYKSGLEVTPAQLKAGEFNIVFDCKPQRWLTSGEDAVTIGEYAEVAGTDNEPYLFRASPQFSDEYDTEIDKIVGGTVAWNQLMQNGDFASDTGWQTSRGTLSVSNNKGTFTVTDANAGNGIYRNNVYVEDHVYFAGATLTPSKNTTSGFFFGGSVAVGMKSITANIANRVETIAKAADTNGSCYVYCNRGSALEADDTCIYENVNIIDLTQMFGSTIADYIYSLETATAGAGVAWFKKLFNKPYYAYNAGELKSVSGLVSHDMTGFNQLNTENAINATNIVSANNNGIITIKDVSTAQWSNTYIGYSDVIAGQTYEVCGIMEYGRLGGSISSTELPATSPKTYPDTSLGKNIISVINRSIASRTFISNFTGRIYWWYCTDSESSYHRVFTFSPCIHLRWDGSRDGEYEPYVKHSYPLDSDLTLRGIPKLDANNNLYYDGDAYESDGTVTRKYGAVNLGTLTWSYKNSSYFEASVSGKANGDHNLICAVYTTASGTTISSMSDKQIKGNASGGTIYVKDSAYTGSAALKAALMRVYLVYELATPTTETADPYQHAQVCDPYGTEEYVTTSIVPVGHNTQYGENPNILVNPTLFESSPLLEVKGYGTIGLNGYEIELNSDKIGRVLVADATSGKATVTLDTSKLEVGNFMRALESDGYYLAANITATGAEGYYLNKPYQKTATDFVYADSRTAGQYGTPHSYGIFTVGSAGHYMVYNESGEYIGLSTYRVELVSTYDGDSTLTFSYTATPQLNPERVTMGAASYITKPIYSNSTKSINEAFIDCENGNAYCVDNGSIISLNQRVDFGSDLPKLASGPNEITCDNTITSLKVVPRWWKV